MNFIKLSISCFVLIFCTVGSSKILSRQKFKLTSCKPVKVATQYPCSGVQRFEIYANRKELNDGYIRIDYKGTHGDKSILPIYVIDNSTQTGKLTVQFFPQAGLDFDDFIINTSDGKSGEILSMTMDGGSCKFEQIICR